MKFDLFDYDRIVTQLLLAVIMPPTHPYQKEHPDRPSHGLVYQLDGAGSFHFADGRTIHCEAHDLVYLPKHCSYTVGSKTIDERGHTACINFQMLELSDILQPTEPFLLHTTNAARVDRLFGTASDIWKRKPRGYMLDCRTILYELLSLAQAELSRPYMMSRQSKRLETAIRYIDDNFASEDIPVEKLAGLSGVSEVYFRKLFKAKYGLPPAKYIKARRIERAKELIASSMCSIETAAELSGFSDAAYFSREFKRVVGMTPGEYRLNGNPQYRELPR